jgi:hypothetical protein
MVLRTAIWLILLGFLDASVAQDFGKIYNTKCRRTVDLTEQFARHVIGLGFKNQAAEPVTAYYLAFTKDQRAHLSSLEVSNHYDVRYKVQEVPGIQGEA